MIVVLEGKRTRLVTVSDFKSWKADFFFFFFRGDAPLRLLMGFGLLNEVLRVLLGINVSM